MHTIWELLLCFLVFFIIFWIISIITCHCNLKNARLCEYAQILPLAMTQEQMFGRTIAMEASDIENKFIFYGGLSRLLSCISNKVLFVTTLAKRENVAYVLWNRTLDPIIVILNNDIMCEKWKLTPSEILAVIGHEIGHKAIRETILGKMVYFSTLLRLSYRSVYEECLADKWSAENAGVSGIMGYLEKMHKHDDCGIEINTRLEYIRSKFNSAPPASLRAEPTRETSLSR